jgi:hypothetical protein
MTSHVRLFSLLVPIVGFAAEASSNLDVVVSGIPAGPSEVVIVVDTVAPPSAPNADDPVAPALPPPQPISDQDAVAPNAAAAAGAKFTLAGRITDAAQSLGAKNRMRVWISENAPPEKNHAGTQISTVDVIANGDDVEFSFNLTAPKTPGTLFLQFGDIPPDFVRDDGSQAPLFVLPDLVAGSNALQVRVEAAPTSVSKL